MKIRNYCLALLFSTLFVGCGNDDTPEEEVCQIEVNGKIKSTETFTYSINFGENQDVAITKDAEHAETSELNYLEGAFKGAFGCVYFYTPKKDFIGRDYVEITHISLSDVLGEPDPGLKTVIKISIDVEK